MTISDILNLNDPGDFMSAILIGIFLWWVGAFVVMAFFVYFTPLLHPKDKNDGDDHS